MTNEFEDMTKTLAESRELRKLTTSQQLPLFVHMYLGHYLKYRCGFVQYALMNLLQGNKRESVVIPLFPGAGATTLITIGYTLWAILGDEGVNHIAVICKSREEARRVQKVLYTELTQNKLLVSDYRINTKKIYTDGLNIRSKALDAKISIGFVSQKVKRMTYKGQEPTVILVDDIGEANGVFDWVYSELLRPSLDESKIVIYGKRSKQQYDDVYLKLTGEIRRTKRRPAHFSFPLFDEHNKCLWKERYTKEEQRKLLALLKKDRDLRDQYLICDTQEVEADLSMLDEAGQIIKKNIPTKDGWDIIIQGIYTIIRVENAEKFPPTYYETDGFSYYGIGVRNTIKVVDKEITHHNPPSQSFYILDS